MMPTLRRLDDGTRYYFLTWRQWVAALAGGGVLYAAVRFSPLSQKWTFTAVLLALATVAVAILPLTGNALGLDRYLAAIVRWTLGPKHFTRAGRQGKSQRGGVLLSSVPVALVDDVVEDRDRLARARRRRRRRAGMSAAPATRPRRARSRDRRVAAIADLVDVAALEPDGLIVTRDGTYVRVIDCEFVPNPITADPAEIASIEDGWASLMAAIPDHQGLSLYAQTDPIPIDDAMCEDEDRVARAIADDLAATPPREDLARTRRRFLQAQRQSVGTAASGDQPAVQARYWIAVPWRPEIAIKQRFRDACTPPTPEHRTSWAAHQARRPRQPALHPADRRPAGRPRDRPAHHRPRRDARGAVGAPAPRRPHPPGLRALRARRPDRPSHHARGRGRAPPGDPRRDHQRPRTGRHQRNRPALACSTPTARWRRRCTSAPSRRRPRRGGWRTCCRSRCPAPSPSTSRVGDRSRTRTSQRRRWARLRAATSYKERRGQLIGSDEEDALDEARELDRELRSTVAATVYNVATYVSFRRLDGDETAFAEQLKSTARAFQSLTDARVLRGAFLNVQSWPCTLPIGVDPLTGDPRVRAAQHRALLTARHRRVRLPARPDRRLQRPRRHARAPGPLRREVPDLPDADRRQGRGRQDGHGQRAADGRDRARHARLHHRPLLDRDRRRRPARPGPLRPAAEPRARARRRCTSEPAARTSSARGTSPTAPVWTRRRSSSCSPSTRC